MYRLKIAATDQVSFRPVPVLMVVKIIWSTQGMIDWLCTVFVLFSCFFYVTSFNKRKYEEIQDMKRLGKGPYERLKRIRKKKRKKQK